MRRAVLAAEVALSGVSAGAGFTKGAASPTGWARGVGDIMLAF